MADYSRQIASSLAAIKARGQAVTITRKTSGAYDPDTGSVAVTETTETGYGLPVAFKQHEIDDSLVKQGDVKLLLAASGISRPAVNDVVTLSTRKFTIKSVSELWPGGDAILFTCVLSGAV